MSYNKEFSGKIANDVLIVLDRLGESQESYSNVDFSTTVGGTVTKTTKAELVNAINALSGITAEAPTDATKLKNLDKYIDDIYDGNSFEYNLKKGLLDNFKTAVSNTSANRKLIIPALKSLFATGSGAQKDIFGIPVHKDSKRYISLRTTTSSGLSVNNSLVNSANTGVRGVTGGSWATNVDGTKDWSDSVEINFNRDSQLHWGVVEKLLESKTSCDGSGSGTELIYYTGSFKCGEDGIYKGETSTSGLIGKALIASISMSSGW